jgi:hypothetical protein
MEHTSGRHSPIFSWWHTHTWSRRSRRSNTPQESSASNFTRSHDRAVRPAKAPFYLGFRESTVAPKCCGLFMYQFASLGLAVNWCGIVPVFWYCYSVTLGSLPRSLDQSTALRMVSGNLTRSISPALFYIWMFSPNPFPGKQDLQSVHCVLVTCVELCLWLLVCRYHPAWIHADCWHVRAAPASESCYWNLEADMVTVAFAGTNTWNAC